MTDFIMDFEQILSKVLQQNEHNQTTMKRAMLFILAPILKLPTINALTTALKIEKDALYRLLDAKDQHGWLRLLRVFAYARLIQLLTHSQTLHESNQSRSRLTIGIDDTSCVSAGKRVPLIGWLWNSVLSKVQKGTQALYFYVVVGDQKCCFPLDLRLCRGKGGRGRPTTSKITLVVNMMTELHRALLKAGCSPDRVTFVADSWFNAGEIFDTARRCGFTLITKSKGSFVFTLRGRRMKISQLLKEPHVWRTAHGAQPYVYTRYVAHHESFGEVILTLVQEDRRVYCLISTNADHSSPKIITDYKLRWAIEVFFKDSKQYLGLKRFGFRSRAKIYGHFVLRALTYHLLDYIRSKLFRRKRTIGECSEWLYRHIFLNPKPKADKLDLRRLKSYVPDFR